jgi:hypothetical protein
MVKGKENITMQQLTIKIKVDDLNKLREYADMKGGNPVSHYIREAVSEYLENHYSKNFISKA